MDIYRKWGQGTIEILIGRNCIEDYAESVANRFQSNILKIYFNIFEYTLADPPKNFVIFSIIC